MSILSLTARSVVSLAILTLFAAPAAAQVTPWPPPDVELFGTIEPDAGCGMVFREVSTDARIRLDLYVDSTTGAPLAIGDYVRISGQVAFGFCLTSCDDVDSCASYAEIEYLAAAPQPFCFGSDGLVGCPCGNSTPPQQEAGCENSTGMGATLHAVGPPTIGAADFTLVVQHAPPTNPALIVAGGSEIAVPFKDGLLCAGAPTDRLETLFIDASGSAESSGDLAADDGVAPGDQRVYQVWYRDPDVGPCGTGSNFTNALRVVWN